MVKIYEVKTPRGTYAINFGEFIGPEYRGKYSCWWGGCGLGMSSKYFEAAKEQLDRRIKADLICELCETIKKAEKIAAYLDGMIDP